jgi:hypothetical protein
LFVAHVPMTVAMIIAASVTHTKVVASSRYEVANHMMVASIAPAVPGALGANPLPSPVAIMVGIKGILLIFTAKLLKKQ